MQPSMSIEYTNMVWNYSPEKAERRLVLLALADYADVNGQCFPSLQQVAAKCHISKDAASKIIIALIRTGCISRTEGGLGRSNRSRYQIHKDAIKVSAASTFRDATKVSGEPTFKDVKVSAERSFEDLLIADKSKCRNGVKVSAEPGPIRKNRHVEPPLEEGKPSSGSGRKKTKSSGPTIPTKTRNLFLQIFSDAYQKLKGVPYTHSRQDFIQLALKWKQYAEFNWDLSAERWTVGVNHYFESNQHRHTLADLAVKFGDFHRAASAGYNKPAGGSNGNFSNNRSGHSGQSTPQSGSSRFGGEEF